MMRGHFSELGELLFDIELVSRNNERIAVEALFDTGFTDWLAMNVQDAESLGWTLIETEEVKNSSISTSARSLSIT